MSTEVKILDEDNFRRSIKDLRDDISETNLLIVGHVNNDPTTVDVIYTGTFEPKHVCNTNTNIYM